MKRAGAKRYVRRSEPVEAVRWTGDNIEEVMAFMEPHRPQYMAGFSNADDLVGTPGGVANKGDYIVRRLDGTAREIWPLTAQELGARYRAEPEPVVALSEVKEALRPIFEQADTNYAYYNRNREVIDALRAAFDKEDK